MCDGRSPWLAGRRFRAAFPGKNPVAVGRKLAAHSCGDSYGVGRARTVFPLSPDLWRKGTVSPAFRPQHPMVSNAIGKSVCEPSFFSTKGSAARRCPEGTKRECGADQKSQAAAAPATVSGELPPKCHWNLGFWEAGMERRPASQETCRRGH